MLGTNISIEAYIVANLLRTALQKRIQVRFEIPSKIPVAHEFLVDLLPEKAKIKKNLGRDPYFGIQLH